MFYGTSFGVGEFFYKSIIPVTLGNIVGGAGFCALPLWFLYGRHDADHHASDQPDDEERNLKGLHHHVKKPEWRAETASDSTLQVQGESSREQSEGAALPSNDIGEMKLQASR